MNSLAAVPAPSDSRLAVRVTNDAVRQLRGGHPWLFEGSIRSVSRAGEPGDLAVVFDDDRRFVAIGLWDPASPIRVKVLHAGDPLVIDAAFFRARIERAVERRAPLAASAGTEHETTGYRVIHGENDALPGLVYDRYDHVGVLKVYSAAWIPHLPRIVPLLREAVPVRSIVLRTARALADAPMHGLVPGESLVGPDVDAPVRFAEHGLLFEADVVHGQKTGHFLDQRDNRVLVASMAEGASVLDVFSCTGGFAVHAAAGGAKHVHSVDVSQPAIDAARRNMALNLDRPEVARCRHEVTVADAFTTMEALVRERRRYDIVIVDPPSFASNAAAAPRAIAGYERLAALGSALVSKRGVLVQASCSSRVDTPTFLRAVHAGAASAGFAIDEVRRTGQPIDHPVGFPEGAYLKAVLGHVHPLHR